jgi:hypothetical protein
MLSMQRFYEAKGWTTGPHLYLASGTMADGIFVMCPPWLEGIHAGPCNATRWGLEVVGDFAARPMSHDQLVLLSEAAAALHDWQHLGADIVAHRDCMLGRTCPGDAAYAQKADIQALLAFALNARSSPIPYTADSPLLAAPHASALTFSARNTNYDQVAVDTITQAYWAQARAVGLDPILCFAQCLHETGNLNSWWCARPRRNPAGIGVTGETSTEPRPAPFWAQRNEGLWVKGFSFPTWVHDAIPAHLGRLLGYALKPGDMSATQWQCYSKAMEIKPLPTAILGCAPTLRGLGGTWAVPGTAYAQAVANKANKLIGAS